MRDRSFHIGFEHTESSNLRLSCGFCFLNFFEKKIGLFLKACNIQWDICSARNFAADLREYRQCAEILRIMGLRRLCLLTNNPLKVQAMEAAGLLVVERVALEVESPESARFYLHTKRKRLGHLLTAID